MIHQPRNAITIISLVTYHDKHTHTHTHSMLPFLFSEHWTLSSDWTPHCSRPPVVGTKIYFQFLFLFNLPSFQCYSKLRY